MKRAMEVKMKRMTAWLAMAALVVMGVMSVSCFDLDAPDDNPDSVHKLQVFFNSPGFRDGTEVNRKPSEFISERIDNARVTVDAAVYGFNKQNIIDALVDAHYRGVEVRLVGDGGEYSRGSPGYRTMEDKKVPVQTGNQFHIMHNKFFIIDGRFVFTGTGNISRSEFTFNNNHWVWMDSQPIAELFTAEFEQMFEGRFSAAKKPLEMPNTFMVGDVEVEVWFAPQDDAMGRILEELRAAHTSVHFQIFAFTKDQVATEFINRHREFEAYNEENGYDELPVMERPKRVTGVFDRSQLHGNGQYHQSYRLLANGVPARLDGNANSRTPGDYQAGGGRMHTKTMILDAGTEDARVVTGSFNWSAAATISNDEVLLILRGEEITDVFMEEFDNIWLTGKDLPTAMCRLMKDNERLTCDDEVEPGDVVINEVHFDGWNAERDPGDMTGSLDGRRPLTNDQFVELYNTTDRPINLSMWTLSNGHDVVMGFTPGTVIGPGEHFLVLDHNTVPLSEGEPQRGDHAFENPNFVLNTANDPRFRSLNLKKAALQLEIRDSNAQMIDVAGNGGPAFAGGRDGDTNWSMQRIHNSDGTIPDGTRRSSWGISPRTQGGDNVNEAFRNFIIADPGEPNSVNSM